MTIDHDEVRLRTMPTDAETNVGEINVLIKEARRRQRLRYLAAAVALIVLIVAVIGLSSLRGGPNASRSATDVPGKSQLAAATSLPLKSKIWTLDMLNTSSGYAVAGTSSTTRDEQLIKTTNEGRSWSVIGALPYSYVAGQTQPLLHFVTSAIGYTQAFRVGAKWLPDNIYVTRNGGTSWSKLALSGQVPSAVNAPPGATSPDFRISKGVVSLVSLRCTVGSGVETGDGCPATLSEYRWGATTPFSSRQVPYLGTGTSGPQSFAYLMVAPSASTALVGEHDSSRAQYSFVLTTNGGRTWSSVSNPCKPSPESGGMTISGVALTSSSWLLNCSQGTGMNHATVLLSETTNDGDTWSTINYTPAWSAQRGGIAGEEDQVWPSNGGNVLWSYSSIGYMQVSTNGGRTWSPITVNGTSDNDNTGGWPVEFDPVGPAGAYLVTKNGQILLTRNGTDFTSVHLLRKP
jgi:photosystem II stability/assembly factor-like uncharacterized protein